MSGDRRAAMLQEFLGQEKPKDLMDSVLHRCRNMSGVRGRAPPSESCSNAKDLTGRGHRDEVFGLWGQNHVVVTHNMSDPCSIKKKKVKTRREQNGKNALIALTPNQINLFLMKRKTRAETYCMKSGVPPPFSSLFILCSRINGNANL